MALLRRRDGQAELALSAMTRIGRSLDNDLVIQDPSVSQFHAAMRWIASGRWEIRDLGSTNGTFVGGVRLAAGERQTLTTGAQISFSETGETWCLVDAGQPMPQARDLASGAREVGSSHLLTLRGADGATVDIVEERRGSWVVESDGAVTEVRNEQTITVGGRTYKLILPLPAPETETPRSTEDPISTLPMPDVQIAFLLGTEPSSISLRVRWTNRQWYSQRAYARALLALAQARLRDQRQPTMTVDDHGWVDAEELCKLAEYDGIGRLNVEVHRARADFARQGVPGAPGIVQRRRGTGQLRIGASVIEILDGPGSA
ncbi:MAG: FHA domain-containing protein [Polyangiaceae bacterium]|nr:FHA domain-containing protein [Polyangiaceae bacterium]